MSSNTMSSGSGTNAGDATAGSTDSADTAAHGDRVYDNCNHYEFIGTVFEAPTTFSTPLCYGISLMAEIW